MTEIPSLDLNFENSPTVWKFLHDDSFVRGLMGPVGSGKSYGCAAAATARNSMALAADTMLGGMVGTALSWAWR